MRFLRRFALWLVMGPIPLGRFAPHVMNFGLGCKRMERVE